MRRRNSARLRAMLAATTVVMVAAVVILRPFGTVTVLGVPMSGASPDAATVVASGCPVGHPKFYYGFADLQARLGSQMGEPIECERPIHINGDTRQKTTTGYAYYRKSDNTPSFTNGWDHWALTDGGLVYWSGDVVDPPRAAAAATPH